ncbi:MAG TPA: phosphate-starvation-inducible PsiE family protein [Burkholderiales bacterium]|nr:phosphate-starvation-inducible PsiE family protein [Burkholderiales bacterium]
MEPRRTEKMRKTMDRLAGTIGHFLVDAFHYLALFAIGGAIVWSAISSFWGMAAKGGASIDDILLLFIYLELGAMVGIYFKTNHMPVRFLIYVAITALTRMMIADVQEKHLHPDMGIILIAGAILLLALAILVIRYGSNRFPSSGPRDTA